jgi:mono/diheme cytochrome c family protein
MRLQHRMARRHTGAMYAAGLVFLAVAGAGLATGLAPEAVAGVAPPDGAQLFRTYCASCHGTTGTGGGPAAMAMKVTPPDLTRIAARNNGVFPSERISQIVLGKGVAAHGERNMPVWGDVFARKLPNGDPKAMVDALVRYLDGLQRRPA